VYEYITNIYGLRLEISSAWEGTSGFEMPGYATGATDATVASFVQQYCARHSTDAAMHPESVCASHIFPTSRRCLSTRDGQKTEPVDLCEYPSTRTRDKLFVFISGQFIELLFQT